MKLHVISSSLGFSNSSWILDSGASDHMTPHRSKFSTYTPCLNDHKVLTAGGETLPVTGIGTVPISGLGFLQNVLHVPKLQPQLLSPRRYVKDTSAILTLNSDGCFVWDKSTNLRIGSIEERQGMLYVDDRSAARLDAWGEPDSHDAALSPLQKAHLFHSHLGHSSFELLKKKFPVFAKDGDLSNIVCEACQYAKHRCTSFNRHSEGRSSPFQLIYSDVWGLSLVASLNGARWLIIFVDDCT